MTSLWWVRRDVRLTDNPTLQAALCANSGNMQPARVIPVFVLDPHLLASTPLRRQDFLFNGLRHLDNQLRELGSGLVVRRGPPEQVLLNILIQSGADAIFAEEDFTPYARARDLRVAESLPLTLIHGQTVLHPLLVHKPDGAAYSVFTPFSRAWKSLLASDLAPIPAPATLPALPFLRSEELPLRSENPLFPAGEKEALRRLNAFSVEQIYGYELDRNRMDLEGTSSLSPYLRFGMLSLRQAVSAAQQAIRNAPDALAAKSAETWLTELIWREFYINIIYHFPRVSYSAFNQSLAHIPWREAEADFVAWKEGRTGVPVVDAGMRQLAETGWMHNRARMIVASFLVKDLLINWQRGERWFMENLLDADPAANNGGWQWTAGTGTDAAPYFRIFNPLLQSQKFDPDGAYIRRWIPELAHLSADNIHAPWQKGLQVPGYPSKPIVDHAAAKEQTLRAYRISKASQEHVA